MRVSGWLLLITTLVIQTVLGYPIGAPSQPPAKGERTSVSHDADKFFLRALQLAGFAVGSGVLDYLRKNWFIGPFNGEGDRESCTALKSISRKDYGLPAGLKLTDLTEKDERVAKAYHHLAVQFAICICEKQKAFLATGALIYSSKRVASWKEECESEVYGTVPHPNQVANYVAWRKKILSDDPGISSTTPSASSSKSSSPLESTTKNVDQSFSSDHTKAGPLRPQAATTPNVPTAFAAVPAPPVEKEADSTRSNSPARKPFVASFLNGYTRTASALAGLRAGAGARAMLLAS